MRKKCYFCNLAEKGDKYLMIENELFFASWDPAPVSKGHAIIVPKKHVVSFFEANSEIIKELHRFSKTVKEKIKEKYNPEAFNIGINDGREAGRSIDHLHVHIIPRYKGDVENPKGGVRNLMASGVSPKAPPEEFR